MRIVVTGGGGQLGTELKLLNCDSIDKKVFTHHELDITNANKVDYYFKHNQCDVIVNCAAYTSVDESESNKIKAFDINEKGVKNLVKACEKYKIRIIHYSTDYVFGEDKNINEFSEDDPLAPLNVYGKSKKKGEEVIMYSSIESIIIRTSWLYSKYGKNFVKTMLELASEDKEIKVVDDQFGNPTYAKDLAVATIEILNTEYYKWNKGGDVFHYSNEGECSWYEFAREIFRISNKKIKIKKVSSREFKTLAKRPQRSCLSKSKIKEKFNIRIPKWEDSLRKMLIEK